MARSARGGAAMVVAAAAGFGAALIMVIFLASSQTVRRGGGRAVMLSVPSAWQRQMRSGSAARHRQAMAAASAFGRGMRVRAKGASRAAWKAALGMQLAAATEAMAADSATGNATNYTECSSWRGCTSDRERYAVNGTTEMLPHQVQFECGGGESAEICYDTAMACIKSSEALTSNMYQVSPFRATELRTISTCKCFVSNGCTPSCNVALYQRWSSNTGINCPANPPVFHPETGVYQYGDPKAVYVAPNDYSFDYYPEYPNPSGHTYNAMWARDVYESQPGIPPYQMPLYGSYGPGDLSWSSLAGEENPYQ
ncbi:hypothetical protein GUITHDRAFT_139813 [Guillardia theta CCMP2712]|uniref:Uncharacterized protein n=2 Tax=Guillardia theta TaxID=55529 RepID=L1J837_GUITC|nr:hypothetical protein GUITHDRAFT_139813 [Guillardia theta CCMP2712]EKX44259.1 hypothetical protein GUITHDRAFT_139813 [Guillardia theta CCMP2712]|mmetsp:Transcript_36093/g.112789  ORF Transcript_36093/g.112789 Transcript_36093/m.112789 type:complete len:311 (+) Transcript_36093:1-933(+)|eukprot:XP_005831239.1 hypothetical protein GUITHDRAFT_139813 [Guillardia theta CCMP2712]